jgi:phosphatidylserine synthase
VTFLAVVAAVAVVVVVVVVVVICRLGIHPAPTMVQFVQEKYFLSLPIPLAVVVICACMPVYTNTTLVS